MYTHKTNKQRKAFSLIELLIVVVIIGVVYTLSVSSFKSMGEEKNKVTIQTLKSYLKKIPHEKNVEFICFNECSNCSIFIDGEKQNEYDNVFDELLNKDVKIYRYDFLLGAIEPLKKIHFNKEDTEDDVCFSYKIDKSGIGEQILVEYKEKVYDFTSYSKVTPKYNSMEELIEAKQQLAEKVL